MRRSRAAASTAVALVVALATAACTSDKDPTAARKSAPAVEQPAEEETGVPAAEPAAAEGASPTGGDPTTARAASQRPQPTAAPSGTPSPSASSPSSPVAEAAATSPTGRIAFTTDDGQSGFVIYTVKPDGSDRKRLTTGWSPRWSPDGERLAFLDGNQPRLFVMDADGSARRQLPTRPELAGDVIVDDPQWSPNGRELAFVSYTPSGGKRGTYSLMSPITSEWRGDIDVVTADANPTVRRLTDGADSFYEPAWSPDSSSVAFLGREARKLHVATNDASSRRTVWTAASAPDLSGTAWAPGNRILVSAFTEGLWQVEPDGSTATRLATDNSDGASWAEPRWSPQHDAVLVERWPPDDGPRSIVVLGAEGGVRFSVPGATASWSSDGTSIVLCADRRVRRVARDGTDVSTVTDLPCNELTAPTWTSAR